MKALELTANLREIQEVELLQIQKMEPREDNTVASIKTTTKL